MENLEIVDQIRNDRKRDLEKLCRSKFNESQIRMIEAMLDQLDSVPKINDFFNLIVEPMKFGLQFDFAPEEFGHKREIAVLAKDQKLSFESSRERERESNNTLILGNNLDALANLLITHRSKIDVIYIDPPYNTESANLPYRDKFAKNAWLSMIKERLQVSKQLLSNDGAIFISVDDNMQAYLKVLMDEIFGEENFLGCLPRVTVKGGKAQNLGIVSSNDYLLIFSKNTKLVKISKKEVDQSYFVSSDDFFEERGAFHAKQALDTNTLGYVKSLDYPIVFNGKTFYPGGYDNFVKRQRGDFSNKNNWRWTWSSEKVSFGIKNNFLLESNGRLWPKKYLNCRISDKKPYSIEFKRKEQPYSSLDFLDNKFSNSNGESRLKSLGLSFSYPKSVEIVKGILKVFGGQNITILDFFAGSGTTGEAVLELNREDGGDRKFILCTLDEDKGVNIGTKVCYERLYRVNHGNGTAGEQIPDWLKKHEPYGSGLNVYRVKYLDVSPNVAHPFQNFDPTPYTELNCHLSLKTDEDFYQKFYELSLKNWWLENE